MTRTLSAAKFDGVLHFAALIEAGESMKDPGLYFRANTTATLSLLEARNRQRHAEPRLQLDRRRLRRA